MLKINYVIIKRYNSSNIYFEQVLVFISYLTNHFLRSILYLCKLELLFDCLPLCYRICIKTTKLIKLCSLLADFEWCDLF